MKDAQALAPYVMALKQAADEFAVDPYVLAAICLRESGAGWAPGYAPKGPAGVGDNGHGFGLMQIDDRYHRDFVSSPDSHFPINQFRYAASILVQNKARLRQYPVLAYDPAMLDRSAIAAYNAGSGSVGHAVISGRDPDSVTTGRNYSEWVITKASDLREQSAEMFNPNPPTVEVA